MRVGNNYSGARWAFSQRPPRPTKKGTLAHLAAEHPGWSAATTTAEHIPFERMTKAQVLEAHRQEHLAGVAS